MPRMLCAANALSVHQPCVRVVRAPGVGISCHCTDVLFPVCCAACWLCSKQLKSLQERLSSLQCQLHGQGEGGSAAAAAAVVVEAAAAAAEAAEDAAEAAGGTVAAGDKGCSGDASRPAPDEAAAATACRGEPNAKRRRVDAAADEDSLPATEPVGAAEAALQAAAAGAAEAAAAAAAAAGGSPVAAQQRQEAACSSIKTEILTSSNSPLSSAKQPAPAAAEQATAEAAAAQRPSGFMRASELIKLEQTDEHQGEGQQLQQPHSGALGHPTDSGRGQRSHPGGASGAAAASAAAVQLPEWDGNYDDWPYEHLPLEQQVQWCCLAWPGLPRSQSVHSVHSVHSAYLRCGRACTLVTRKAVLQNFACLPACLPAATRCLPAGHDC